MQYYKVILILTILAGIVIIFYSKRKDKISFGLKIFLTCIGVNLFIHIFWLFLGNNFIYQYVGGFDKSDWKNGINRELMQDYVIQKYQFSNQFTKTEVEEELGFGAERNFVGGTESIYYIKEESDGMWIKSKYTHTYFKFYL